MQQFRKITSLQEDMEALGLTKSPRRDAGFASEREERLSEGRKPKQAASSSKALTESRQLEERKKASHKRRLESAGHAKRKSRTEAKGSAEARRRLVVRQAMGESITLLENLKEMNLQVSGNVYKTLREGFKNVDRLAKTLGRKYAVAEDVMLKMSMDLPVENPDQPYYGYENPEDENTVDGGKIGDATDSADDAPDGNVESDDTQPDEGLPKGNVTAESRRRARMEGKKKSRKEDEEPMTDDELEMLKKKKEDEKEKTEDDDEDEKDKMMGKDGNVYGEDEDEDQDDEEEKKKKEAEKEKDKVEGVDMSDEMFNIRLEAQDVMDQLKTSVISPAQAGNILRDMVQYLGGALKTYMDLAQNIGKYAYAGIGAPPPNPEMVPSNGKMKNNYAGLDQLDTEPASPQPYGQRT